ncbi:uncharacterized protein Tco025E_04259 [Trypanosoma conorhini]|uniref:FAD/NAD(P)-binding domain-containing protein n=1 Tax=Trypanosoma conorhini TaxID=83891 RepID=A0A422PMU2_9TRYP|nr:uncharacterized protein Tco025E_04259 [Trypanosoma conorhini]RNF19012.1 hypothetical protein Tco025E_04259 [Trypanosoma conorhini]
MYLPKNPQRPKENPFAVQKSRRFIFASCGIALLTTGVTLYFALEKARERQRRPEGALRQQRTGRRVVIIGAGAAGSALAASLTSASPELHVTVIEREKKHVFQAMVPLAHVGHRSYDLNTTGGVDFLRSPATWNVTRDASLVQGEVVHVDTARNEVVVVEAPQSASAAAPSAAPTPLTASAASNSASLVSRCVALLKSWWSLLGGAASSERRRYPYDALVVACGAERTIGPLQRFISPSQVDRYRIAVNPGITRDCLVHLFQGTVLHVKVPPASFVADGIMRYPSRQHDGTFVGTVNTIWRYLFYFNKLSLCPYIAVTADRQPSDAFPSSLNDRILSFWRSRGVDFVNCSYLSHLDPVRSEATLYNYVTREKRVVPYQLLLLDLPLAAPAFIRSSGLSAGTATEGFVDVHPDTMQHRVHANVFALGDCAALPTVKSYGAVFAQVPVVSHNVRQLLQHADEAKEAKAGAAALTAGFARYDGYSSFHVVMTTWRAMWPELMYGKPPLRARGEGGFYTLESAPLVLTNHHLWDNLAWIDVRGFLNAAYYQLFFYEVMFYFLFTRAAWHPPSWFSVPTFSEESGERLHGGLM